MNSPVSREFAARNLQYDNLFMNMTDCIPFKHNFLPEIPEGAWLVGGSIRDLLAGRQPDDIDLATAGNIREIAVRISAATGGTIVDLGKNGFEIIRVASPAITVDIAPLNGPDIEADLQQRDFTVNAMAWDLISRQLVDPTGGLADMRKKRIRMVSPRAFAKDPARLVRAYRLAAALDYSIDTDTQAAIAKHCRRITDVAAERIWSELAKLLVANRSAPIIRQMAQSGLLTAILPELEPTIGCRQNRHHAFDVFEHSLQALEHLETLLADFENRYPFAADISQKMRLADHAAMLKYACLLHDAGKPATKQADASGEIHFYGHEAKSADMAAVIGRRLRLSRKQREVADAFIRNHTRPLHLFQAFEDKNLGPRGKIRFFNRCGDLTLPIIVHTMADILAKRPALEGRNLRFIDFCGSLLKDYGSYLDRKATLPPLINGHDLMTEFDLKPSPLFKQILKQVDERRLNGAFSTRGQALHWVGSYLEKMDV
jgi:tRNA nucleotidyltransferase/poly(A) polymerase